MNSNIESGIISGITEISASNEYTNISPISTKGIFFIFKAKKNNKWYILKGINEEYKNITIYETILQREFEVGARLSHNNIAGTLFMDSIEGYGKVMIEEFVDGKTLDSYLKTKHTAAELGKIVGELFDAVEYIHHHQIIHRDLKPDNIMITHNGSNVKLIDLGLCDEDSYDLLKQPVGTKKYSSPEQLSSGVTLDCRTDIYSLGKILKDIYPKPNQKIKNIIKRCTNEDRNKRPANMYELKELWNKKEHSAFSLISLFTICMIALFGFSYLYLNQAAKQINKTADDKTTVEEVNRGGVIQQVTDTTVGGGKSLMRSEDNQQHIQEKQKDLSSPERGTEAGKHSRNTAEGNPSRSISTPVEENGNDAQTKLNDSPSSVYTTDTKQSRKTIDSYLDELKKDYIKTKELLENDHVPTFEEGHKEIIAFSSKCNTHEKAYRDKYGENSELSILAFVGAEYTEKLKSIQNKLPKIADEISRVRAEMSSVFLKDDYKYDSLSKVETELTTKFTKVFNDINKITIK